jgi:hypothetical protein
MRSAPGRERGSGRKTTRLGSAVALAVVSLLATSDVAASPQDAFGFGPRSVALAGAGAALGGGYESVWANPALLSLRRERELSLGFQGIKPIGKAEGPGMPGHVRQDGVRGTLIGAVLPVPFGGVLRDRVTLGMGFFTPTDVVVRGRVLYPEKPQFPLLADRFYTVALQAGVGLHVLRGLRLGAGVSALAAIAGTALVATDTSGQVGTKVDDQLVTSYAPIVGASYESGNYRAGVTYRGRLEARFAVLIEVRDLGSLEVPPLEIAGLAQFDPRQIQVEIARVRGPLRAALGATWKQWSAYPGAPEATVRCPPEQPSCAALQTPPPGFVNTVVFRVAGELDVSRSPSHVGTVRGGLVYEPTPVPLQTSTSNLFDSSRAGLAAGFSIDLRAPLPPVRVESFAQYHHLFAREHPKPTGTVTSSGSILVGGVAGTVRF